MSDPAGDRERQDPESASEALARARQHGRKAATEALAAVQALLDAGALAGMGVPARGSAAAPLIESLERARDWLGGDPDGPVLEGVFDALDEEVGRWEQRSREDPDARLVLRAFLAVREVLWEVSRRGSAAARPEAPPRPREEAKTAPPKLRRVQVEG